MMLQVCMALRPWERLMQFAIAFLVDQKTDKEDAEVISPGKIKEREPFRRHCHLSGSSSLVQPV